MYPLPLSASNTHACLCEKVPLLTSCPVILIGNFSDNNVAYAIVSAKPQFISKPPPFIFLLSSNIFDACFPIAKEEGTSQISDPSFLNLSLSKDVSTFGHHKTSKYSFQLNHRVLFGFKERFFATILPSSREFLYVDLINDDSSFVRCDSDINCS